MANQYLPDPEILEKLDSNEFCDFCEDETVEYRVKIFYIIVDSKILETEVFDICGTCLAREQAIARSENGLLS